MITQSEYQTFLELFPVFRLPDEYNSSQLQQSLTIRQLAAKTSIQDSTESAKEVYFIKSGLMRIFAGDENTQVLLQYLTSGDSCFLTSAKISHSEYMDFKIESATDLEMYVLDEKTFSRLESCYTDIRNYTDSSLASAVKSISEVLKVIIKKSLYEKTEIYLRYLTEKLGSNELKLTHDFIAKDLNTSREVITRILSKMKADGRIKIRNRIINTSELIS